MDKGWIKLYRKLLDSDMYKNLNSKQKVIMLTCLLLANHERNKWEFDGEVYEVKSGQFITSLEKLKEKCGKDISVQNVRTALLKLEKWGFLTNKSTKTGRLITVVNWELYQGNNDEDNKDINKELTKHQQRANKELTTNKNDKNDKNDKKYIEDILSSEADNTTVPYQEIVNLYNATTKSLPKVKALSDKRRRAIKANWNKHKNIELFKTVFTKAEASDFLSGRSGRWNGCNFDWLINYNNFIKVLEGTYDNKKHEPSTVDYYKEAANSPYGW